MLRIALTIALLSNFSMAADWPNWRGPNQDGISLEKDWDPLMVSDSTKPLWTAEVGIGFSIISVADGKAITMGNINKKTDVVTCLDANTGAVVWKFEYPERLEPKFYEGGPNASVTIAEGKVYTLSKTGKAFCLNLNDGKVIWQKQLDAKTPTWGFAGSPLLVGEKVIYNVFDSGLALNKNTGEIIWSSKNKESGYSTAVAVGSGEAVKIYLFGRDSLVCVQASDGKMLWSYPWKTKYDVNAADPIVVGNEIFITSGYNHGSALLRIEDSNVVKVWENKNMRTQMSGPVYIDGFLYGFDDAALACIDWKTGTTKWSERSPGRGSLMAADGKLIVISDKGKLMIVKATPEKFELISSAQVLDGRCWTMPTLANGKIYVRNADGKVVCIDVSMKKTACFAEMGGTDGGNWPQWKGLKQDNKSTETGLLKKWPAEGPAKLWSYEGLGAGYSTVSIADGCIYTTGITDASGNLTCLDLNGKLLWKQSYGPEWTKNFPAARSTPTIDGGKVYVISGLGQVACFDAKTGKPLWQKDSYTEYEGQFGNWGLTQSPVIDGDQLFFFVCGKKATVIAMDKNTGKTLWASPSLNDEPAYCTPLVFEWNGKKQLTGYTSNHLIGVDTQTGNILWKVAVLDYSPGAVRYAHPNTPVFRNGRIFGTSGYNMGSVMVELDPNGTSSKQVWTNVDFDNHHGSVVLVGDYIYGANWNGNGNGNWICVDWKTGKTMYDTHWENKGSLTYADGMLYCYEEKGGTVGLAKADPAGFEIISSFPITFGKDQHWAHPVVCGKRLYIRHGDVLTVYDIEEKSKIKD